MSKRLVHAGVQRRCMRLALWACLARTAWAEIPQVVGTAIDPQSLTVVGRKLYFTAIDEEHGRELWVVDGPGKSELQVVDLWPGAVGSSPRQLTPQGNHLWFAADRGPEGPCDDVEVFRTDGSAMGTISVTQCPPEYPYGDGRPVHMVASANRIYWSSRCLYTSQGASGDTVCLKSFDQIGELVLHGDEAFFFAMAGYDTGIWRSDGTAAGTAIFFAMQWPTYVYDLTRVPSSLFDSQIFMVEEENSPGLRVLRAVGQTESLEDVVSKPAVRLDMGVVELTAINELLLFSRDDGVHGYELWKAGSGPDDTELLRDIAAGADGSQPQILTRAGNVAYFSASEPGSGRELWKTDGTTSGTIMASEISPGPADSNPSCLTPAPFDDGVIYFASGSDGPSALWHTDDSGSTTALTDTKTFPLTNPREAVVLGLNIFFSAGTPGGGYLWQLDLTSPRQVRWLSPCLAGVLPGATDANCNPAFDHDADADVDLLDVAAFLNRLD